VQEWREAPEWAEQLGSLVQSRTIIWPASHRSPTVNRSCLVPATALLQLCVEAPIGEFEAFAAEGEEGVCPRDEVLDPDEEPQPVSSAAIATRARAGGAIGDACANLTRLS
jgi:hypothetical protein